IWLSWAALASASASETSAVAAESPGLAVKLQAASDTDRAIDKASGHIRAFGKDERDCMVISVAGAAAPRVGEGLCVRAAADGAEQGVAGPAAALGGLVPVVVADVGPEFGFGRRPDERCMVAVAKHEARNLAGL